MEGNRIYTGSSDKTINIWELDHDGKLIETLTGHDGTVTCLKSRGDLLFSSSDDKTIRIWTVSNDALANNKSNDSTQAIAEESKASSQGSKRHRCLLRVLHGHTSGIRCFDVNQNILFSGDIYGTVRVWHVDSGNCLCIMRIRSDGKYDLEMFEMLSITVNRTVPSAVVVSEPIMAIE